MANNKFWLVLVGVLLALLLQGVAFAANRGNGLWRSHSMGDTVGDMVGMDHSGAYDSPTMAGMDHMADMDHGDAASHSGDHGAHDGEHPGGQCPYGKAHEESP